ncbi:TPA: hypothetical protein ACF36V_002556 [Escherichia coli]
MQAIGFIVYIVVGLFQLAVIMAGLESWLGLHWIIAAPIAFIVSYIPFVGAIVGMIGAVDVWRWEWCQAAFSSLVGSSLLLSAVECHHFSNGYHSEKERDMSQAAFAAFKFTGFVFVIVRHNSRDVFADPA